MRQAFYKLETHTMGGIAATRDVVCTRPEARVECRKIDTDEEGQRRWGQATTIRFVRYVDG